MYAEPFEDKISGKNCYGACIGYMIGKAIRMNRLKDKISGTYILVPLDHGFTMGPIQGLQNIKRTVGQVTTAGATGIVVHKGLVRHIQSSLNQSSLLIHLSGSIQFSLKPNMKIIMGTVSEAISLGADGISLHVNLGGEDEETMLSDLSMISTECARLGFPLFVMMYIRKNGSDSIDPGLVAHAARIADEAGADLVKVNYTGSKSSFEEVVQGCNIPIVIAGGKKKEEFSEFLKDVNNAILAGAEGVSVGRNIFQAEDVEARMSRLINVVRDAKIERGH